MPEIDAPYICAEALAKSYGIRHAGAGEKVVVVGAKIVRLLLILRI